MKSAIADFLEEGFQRFKHRRGEPDPAKAQAPDAMARRAGPIELTVQELDFEHFPIKNGLLGSR